MRIKVGLWGSIFVLLPVSSIWYPELLSSAVLASAVIWILLNGGGGAHAITSPLGQKENDRPIRDNLRDLGYIALVIAILGAVQFLPGPTHLSAPAAWIQELPGMSSLRETRNPTPADGLSSLLNLFVILLAVFLLKRVLFEPRILMVWAYVSATLMGLLALLVLTQSNETGANFDHFTLGAMVNENTIAGLMAIGAVLASGFFLKALSRHHQSAAVGFAISFLLCLRANMEIASRGATAAMLGGLICLGFMSWSKFRKTTFVSLLAVSLVGVLVALIFYPEVVLEQLSEGLDSRADIWSASFGILQGAPWLGLGLNSFETQFALFSDFLPPAGAKYTHPESSWVTLLFEIGGIGIVSLGLLIVILIKPHQRASAQSQTRGYRSFNHIGYAVAVAWAIAGFSDISLHRPALIAFGLPALVSVSRGNFAYQPLSRIQQSILLLFIIGVGFAQIQWQDRRSAPPPIARYENHPTGVELASTTVPLLSRDQYSTTLHHQLGWSAYNHRAYNLALKHWRFVSELLPANSSQIETYASAIHTVSPELATELWHQLLGGAPEQRLERFQRILTAHAPTSLGYWNAFTADYPNLKIVIANSPTATGQRAFDSWVHDTPHREAVNVYMAVNAFALWGTSHQFSEWINDSLISWDTDLLPIAEKLGRSNRHDLAWSLISTHYGSPPSPAPLKNTRNSSLPIGEITNFTEAAIRISQIPQDDPDYLIQLQNFASHPKAPNWFALRLAHKFGEIKDYRKATDWGIQALKKRPSR